MCLFAHVTRNKSDFYGTNLVLFSGQRAYYGHKNSKLLGTCNAKSTNKRKEYKIRKIV